MAKRSKRYRNLLKQINTDREYPLEEAVKILKQIANAKFPETVEFVMHLNIDPKQATQQVRGSFSLPHGVGKTKRVIAFCPPDKVQEALDAGAVKAGLEDLVKEIEKGWMDFDVAVATPESRKVIGRLGRLLGARGLMPNPKSGTVGPDVAQLVKDFAAGKIEYRNDNTGNIHAPVGRVDFPPENLVENIRAFYNHIVEKRPSAVKGTFVKSTHVCTTMSPALKVKP